MFVEFNGMKQKVCEHSEFGSFIGINGILSLFSLSLLNVISITIIYSLY